MAAPHLKRAKISSIFYCLLSLYFLSIFLFPVYISLMKPWFLCLDLSSALASFAIFEDEVAPRLVAEISLPEGQNHSESFLPLLQTALAEEDYSLKSLSRIVMPYGPGSFTGLRVAYASAKALAFDNAVVLTGLHAHEVRALNYQVEHPESSGNEICVCTRIAAGRFVRTDFSSDMKRVSEAVVENIPSICLSDNYLLRAKHLGYALPKCRLREEATSPSEKAALSPQYFGASRFD